MGNWVDFGATVTAAIAAVLAWRSLHQGERALHADVLLRLDQEMREHWDIHVKLRPRGEWSGERGPGEDEWPPVEAYMGLFERINFFIDEELIGINQVEHFYGYRYHNIVRNPVIYQEKLVLEKSGWKDFIELGQKLKQHEARRTLGGRAE